jgi:hypothetical protein
MLSWNNTRLFLVLIFHFAVGKLVSGCFTTLQTAKVSRGLNLSLNSGVLTDQQRRGKSQKSDFIATITPSLGSRHVEFGIPFGFLFSGGLENFWNELEYLDDDGSRRFLVMPYLKIGINQSKKNKFALLGQCVYLIPYSVSGIYSHDFKKLTTYLSFKKVLHHGWLEDDPIGKFRFNEHKQSILVFSMGAELPVKHKPVIEIGVLRNRFKDFSAASIYIRENPGYVEPHRVLYDFYLAGRINLTR